MNNPNTQHYKLIARRWVGKHSEILEETASETLGSLTSKEIVEWMLSFEKRNDGCYEFYFITKEGK